MKTASFFVMLSKSLLLIAMFFVHRIDGTQNNTPLNSPPANNVQTFIRYGTYDVSEEDIKKHKKSAATRNVAVFPNWSKKPSSLAEDGMLKREKSTKNQDLLQKSKSTKNQDLLQKSGKGDDSPESLTDNNMRNFFKFGAYNGPKDDSNNSKHKTKFIVVNKNAADVAVSSNWSKKPGSSVEEGMLNRGKSTKNQDILQESNSYHVKYQSPFPVDENGNKRINLPNLKPSPLLTRSSANSINSKRTNCLDEECEKEKGRSGRLHSPGHHHRHFLTMESDCELDEPDDSYNEGSNKWIQTRWSEISGKFAIKNYHVADDQKSINKQALSLKGHQMDTGKEKGKEKQGGVSALHTKHTTLPHTTADHHHTKKGKITEKIIPSLSTNKSIVMKGLPQQPISNKFYKHVS